VKINETLKSNETEFRIASKYQNFNLQLGNRTSTTSGQIKVSQ